MALKDTWRDRVNGVDVASADDINAVAQAVIDLEQKPLPEIPAGKNGKDAYWIENAKSSSDINKIISNLSSGAYSSSFAIVIVASDFGAYKQGDVLWVWDDGAVDVLFNTKGEVSEEELVAKIEEYFAENPINVPESLSDLKDDANHRTVTDSEKATWSAKENAGTAASKVSIHNTATDAHNDIRLLIEGLTTRLNALADNDDTTLDQMSEIVAYIKSNKSLIDDITTKKVNVTDIIDNLTTNVANKPLSAAQGVALKSLIDEIYATIGDINTILESI